MRLIPKLDPRVLAEIKRERRDIVVGLVCVAAAGAVSGVGLKLVELVVKFFEDRKLHGFSDLKDLGLICLATMGLFLVRYVLTRIQTYTLSRAAARLTNQLRQKLVHKLLRLPVGYFNDRRTGSLQSVITNDVTLFQSAIGIIRDSVDAPVKVIVGVGFVLITDWRLAAAATPIIALAAWLIDRNSKQLKKAQIKVQESLARGTALSQELLSGIRVVKSFSAQAKIEKLYDVAIDENYEDQMVAVRHIAAIRPMVELLGAVLVSVLLFVSGWLALIGQLDLAKIVGIIWALDFINQGSKSLASVNNTYTQVVAATDHIYNEVLEQPDESLATGSQTLSSPKGQIEFRDVSFNYADGTPALKGVSFVIEPEESLALVGPSGAGKSTIADLMLRFYEPTSGQILFDGVDYQELDIHWLRLQFGVVPQQTFLFAGTIADNLKLGKDDATDEEIKQALAQANVTPFVDSSPQGLQTMLGERGTRLSGGEMQRLSIARALLLKPRVLVLDEATSNLDAHSEKVVTDALDKAMANRTTLLIAHRLTTAARATTIVMLRKGEVIERGSHTDLMSRDGAYATMYRAFMHGALSDEIT